MLTYLALFVSRSKSNLSLDVILLRKACRQESGGDNLLGFILNGEPGASFAMRSSTAFPKRAGNKKALRSSLHCRFKNYARRWRKS
jgi:hypothetical protein